MRFNIANITLDDKFIVIEIYPENKIIAEFPFKKGVTNLYSKEIAGALAGDYCEFLNNKYCDKEINKEWPRIDRESRIKYHEEQIRLLKSKENVSWNEDGDGVE
jgi:hypothetical protein